MSLPGRNDAFKWRLSFERILEPFEVKRF